MKKRWISFIVLSIVVCICSVVCFVKYNYKGFIIFFMIFLAYLYFINLCAKKILKQQYQIESEPGIHIWANDSYYNLRKEKLVTFLESKNIYTEKKIKELISICNKEVEKRKRTGFINWGIFLSIFVPLWSQFISVIFNSSVKTVNDAIQLFAYIFLLVIYIFFILSIVNKLILQDILNDYINKVSNNYKELSSMLEDILFEIE